MMRINNPIALIVIGGTLIFAGFGLAFSMVLRLLESGFALNFLAYVASLVGMLLTLLGVLQRNERNRF